MCSRADYKIMSSTALPIAFGAGQIEATFGTQPEEKTGTNVCQYSTISISGRSTGSFEGGSRRESNAVMESYLTAETAFQGIVPSPAHTEPLFIFEDGMQDLAGQIAIAMKAGVLEWPVPIQCLNAFVCEICLNVDSGHD